MFHKGSTSLGVAKVVFWVSLSFGVIASYTTVQNSAALATSSRDVVETGFGITAGTLAGVGPHFTDGMSAAGQTPQVRVGASGSAQLGSNYRGGTTPVPQTKAQKDALKALEKANKAAGQGTGDPVAP